MPKPQLNNLDLITSNYFGQLRLPKFWPNISFSHSNQYRKTIFNISWGKPLNLFRPLFHEHKKYLKEFTSIQVEPTSHPYNIYLFIVNNRNTRKWCDICSKLMIKSPERRQWRLSGVFIVNFKHISHLFLEFLLLTMNK